MTSEIWWANSSDTTNQATDLEEALTIGLVAHYVFCPRRAWLEAIGEKTDTEQMAVGTSEHASTDDTSRGRARVDRGVDVRNDKLGYSGRCDTVERHSDGHVSIVEFKATPVRRRPDVTEPMVIQLALQALALEDMGEVVHEAAIYFVQHQKRVTVDLSSAVRSRAEIAIKETRDCLKAGIAPLPLEDEP